VSSLQRCLSLKRLIDKSFYVQVYGLYLFFQLSTHKQLYDDGSAEKPETIQYDSVPKEESKIMKFIKRVNPINLLKYLPNRKMMTPDPEGKAASNNNVESSTNGPMNEEEEEEAELTMWGAVIVLLVVTGLVGFTAEVLVDSIDGFASNTGVPKEFIGLILLPIVGNAAEHATAVMVSLKDKMMLSLSVAIGSSIVSFLLSFQQDSVNLLAF
jgi:Ca2+:H+ antiporter